MGGREERTNGEGRALDLLQSQEEKKGSDGKKKKKGWRDGGRERGREGGAYQARTEVNMR